MQHRRLVEESVQFGVSVMWMFVEVGVIVELRCIEAWLRSKEYGA